MVMLMRAPQINVTDTYVRGTVQGRMATLAFMKLTSAKNADLDEARSSVAGVVESQEFAWHRDIMRRRALKPLDRPATWSN